MTIGVVVTAVGAGGGAGQGARCSYLNDGAHVLFETDLEDAVRLVDDEHLEIRGDRG